MVGALTFAALRQERSWPPELVHRFRLVAQVFASALARKRSDEALRHALGEVERLRDELRYENDYLRQEVEDLQGPSLVVGRSAPIKAALEQARMVAATDATVLLMGETGTGKELFASQVHDLSARRERVMVRVNCAAIPAALIESELFGREKGAYTGALSRQAGRFEVAHRSTLFLDEIGDLPLETQVKLLRVLEERQFERLGSSTPTRVDVRIIAATNRDLERRDCRWHVPRRPVLPAQRLSDQGPAAARAARRHPAAGVAVHRPVFKDLRQAGRLGAQGEHAGVATLLMARQRPRAAQRHRACRDRLDVATADYSVAKPVGIGGACEHRAGGHGTRTTSARSSTAPAGACAASAARPSCWR